MAARFNEQRVREGFRRLSIVTGVVVGLLLPLALEYSRRNPRDTHYYQGFLEYLILAVIAGFVACAAVQLCVRLVLWVMDGFRSREQTGMVGAQDAADAAGGGGGESVAGAARIPDETSEMPEETANEAPSKADVADIPIGLQIAAGSVVLLFGTILMLFGTFVGFGAAIHGEFDWRGLFFDVMGLAAIRIGIVDWPLRKWVYIPAFVFFLLSHAGQGYLRAMINAPI